MADINKIINNIQEDTGISFQDTSLLHEALTHTSYAYENDLQFNYERLEFLGDAILEMIISEELFKRFPNFTEGQLTRLRANIVRQKSLVKIARELKLNNYVLLGRGELLAGGQQRNSLLADVLEAVIGAYYLDAGIDSVRKFILKSFDEAFSVNDNVMQDDYKTILQETLQSTYSNVKIEYQLLNSEGPDHNKRFEVGLYVNGEYQASGIGKSKKAAEQEAASKMLIKLN